LAFLLLSAYNYKKNEEEYKNQEYRRLEEEYFSGNKTHVL